MAQATSEKVMLKGDDNYGKPLSSEEVIERFSEQAQADPAFQALLVKSLVAAERAANPENVGGLTQAFYDALEWPQNLEDYKKYLVIYSQYRPVESNKAFLIPDPQPPYPDLQTQEVIARLNHFYWLIDQPVRIEEDDDAVCVAQDYGWYADWLVLFAESWGSFLDTPASFDEEILETFLRNPLYPIHESLIDGRPNTPSGWLTWNQFFARELNPGLRPIADRGNNRVLTLPADCQFKAKYEIDMNGAVDKIMVKGTHPVASVQELLHGSPYADSFNGGLFMHSYLTAHSYHRFHSPVSGTVVECRVQPGLVYTNVVITPEGQYGAPDGATNGYEFKQMRGIFIVDTAGSDDGDVGLVAVIPIGMHQVSGVHMTAVTGTKTVKGDEFGFFTFGSDMIVILQDQSKWRFDEPVGLTNYGTEFAQFQGP